MTPTRSRLISAVVAYLARLRFPTLFLLTVAALAVDAALPDGLPFLDEVLLALAAALLSAWKRGDRARGDEAAGPRRSVGLVLALGLGGWLGCGGSGGGGLVALSGDAFPFNVGADARLPDATVTVLEWPEMSMVTGADGHFRFDGLPPGGDATLTLEHPDYHRIQTGTIRLDAGGAERVTFQAVNPLTYWGMGLLIGMLPDEKHKCQMVTTVTRVGKSLYDEGAHGEAGATVTIDPPLPPENGPIYFGSDVLPDPSLTETSDDGGVVFVQVPPGEYTWTATKPGVRFTQVRMKCRAGWLVNASPPWGLQALE